MKKSNYRGGSLAWLSPFLAFILLALATTSLSRLLLVAWQWDRVVAAGDIGFIFVQGLRFDLVLIGLLIGLLAAVTPLILTVERLVRPWALTICILLQALLVLVVFMEFSTPSFIAEYDIRPNRLFFEYLNHPKEVLSMLLGAYKLPLFITVAMVPLTVYLTHRVFRRSVRSFSAIPVSKALILTPLVLVVATMAVRSTFDHRPVNPSTVAYSSDPLVNTMALNSTYSTYYALYEMLGEDVSFAYGRIDEIESVKEMQKSMALPANAFTQTQIPTLHWQEATEQFEKPKNLVIIIEESLGAEHVGIMGGVPVTPNLDRLSTEGIWFDNMYATGTRSVRGLEAILTGFPPTASRSVVKLSKSQRNFFTLGELLRREGYETSFLYGGEAHFDNMRRFFSNNGFSEFVDKNKITDPVFIGSWGASDEDVFNEAHRRFESVGEDQPFFSVVFTTSNHSPYDFPAGRVEPFEQPLETVKNAIQYADYALGEFIDNARQSSYWDDTIFVIVADHNSRVHGAELVPVERFHIPCLILGKDIEPRTVERLTSQIDLLPTLLSMIGVSAYHPAVGIDLTRPDIDSIPGRATLQYGQNQAYMEEDQVVVFRRDKEPEQYVTDGSRLVKSANNPELISKAQNLSAWPWLAYTQERYRLDAPSIKPKLDLHANRKVSDKIISVE